MRREKEKKGSQPVPFTIYGEKPSCRILKKKNKEREEKEDPLLRLLTPLIREKGKRKAKLSSNLSFSNFAFYLG